MYGVCGSVCNNNNNKRFIWTGSHKTENIQYILVYIDGNIWGYIYNVSYTHKIHIIDIHMIDIHIIDIHIIDIHIDIHNSSTV